MEEVSPERRSSKTEEVRGKLEVIVKIESFMVDFFGGDTSSVSLRLTASPQGEAFTLLSTQEEAFTLLSTQEEAFTLPSTQEEAFTLPSP